MAMKSPANDDWIRYRPAEGTGLRLFNGPVAGDAWRPQASRGAASATNPLCRSPATGANSVSTMRDSNLDRAWKGCGKSNRDEVVSNGFDLKAPAPVVAGFGGTNWGAYPQGMSPSVGERPRLEGATHRIPTL